MLGRRLLGLRVPANATLICHASRVNFGPACNYATSLSHRAVARSTASLLTGARRLLEYDAAVHAMPCFSPYTPPPRRPLRVSPVASLDGGTTP
eukprot:1718939-Pleurochrysis_carterae.AAC.2